MMTKLTFEDIDPEVLKTNGWDTLDIYSNDNLVARVPLSDVDPSGRLEVLLENAYDGTMTARYSTINPLAPPKLTLGNTGKMVNVEKIYPETLSGSLDHIRKSLTENRKSSKTPIS